MADSKISADYIANPFAWDGTEVLPGIKAGNNGAGTVAALQTYFATLKTALNEAPPVSVASAATTPIASVAANTINVTGATTISAFDAAPAGAVRRLVFGGALTLTHNGSSLILPGAANITTAAGDVATVVSLGGGNWRAVSYQRVSGAPVAGAGLSYFLEAAYATAPNLTVSVSQWQAVAGTSSADVALTPKSTGAVLRQVPDGTSAGGNKRGSHATDFQALRSAATQVASGQSAFAVNENNTASGQGSSAFGYNNSVSGSYAVACGGGYSTVSGGYAASLAGNSNVVDGAVSASLGGANLSTRGIAGLIAFGAAATASGKRQADLLLLAADTTGASAVALSSDTLSAGSANQLIIPDNSVVTVTGTICARHNVSQDAKGWTFSATIKRESNASATTLVGSPSIAVTGADAGASAWAVAIVADTVNGGLRINVTGEAGKTVQWSASLLGAFAGS